MVETEVVYLCLLSPFIASVTGLLLCTTQEMLTPVKSLQIYPRGTKGLLHNCY